MFALLDSLPQRSTLDVGSKFLAMVRGEVAAFASGSFAGPLRLGMRWLVQVAP